MYAPKAPNVQVLALGSAFPPNAFTNLEMMNGCMQNHLEPRGPLNDQDKAWLENLYKKTSIDTCYINLPQEKLFARMGLEEYARYTQSSLFSMASVAAESALEGLKARTGKGREQITHLIYGTMTAVVVAPPMDVHLVTALGLPATTQRLHVESIGCLTGFRCLGLALTIAKSDPKAKVLVVVADVRSALTNLLPEASKSEANEKLSYDPELMVVTSLFRDSGGAAVVGQHCSGTTSRSHSKDESSDALLQRFDEPLDGLTYATSVNKPGEKIPYKIAALQTPLSSFHTAPTTTFPFTLVDHMSYLVPNTLDDVWLKMYDDGAMHLFLSKDLPLRVAQHLRGVMDPFLAKNGVSPQECLWAVHTGGPKVVRSVKEAMDLKDEQLCATSYALSSYGNLSGASNLIVLGHVALFRHGLVQQTSCNSEAAQKALERDGHHAEKKEAVLPTKDDLAKYTHTVGLSFGPGIGVEIVLLKNSEIVM